MKMKAIWIAGAVVAGALFWYAGIGEGESFYVGKVFEREAKVLFVGDMSFDRYVRQWAEKKGEDHIFSCEDPSGKSLGDFLKKADLAVGNLEGPITDNPSRSIDSEVGSPENYVFTFPPSSAKLLFKNNFRLVSLANNHIGNFGQEGIASTKRYLREAKVDYIDSQNIFRTELAGQKISFIAFNEFEWGSAPDIASKIKSEKQSGQKVIVYAHWGDEYIGIPQRAKDYAKLFAESGADLIIGSHPHVVLGSEKIISPQPSLYSKERETVVYYSLGNFIFDQYWNEEVRTGLMLELLIKGDDLAKWQIIEHKSSLQKDGRTCLMGS